MAKTKKEPVVASSVWWCDTCKTGEMEQGSMLAHLQTVHHLETKGLKCNKKMVMHLDCSDSFHSTYEVTVKTDSGELKLTNSTCNPRSKDDLMRYAD